jgi:hypothetical protein
MLRLLAGTMHRKNCTLNRGQANQLTEIHVSSGCETLADFEPSPQASATTDLVRSLGLPADASGLERSDLGRIGREVEGNSENPSYDASSFQQSERALKIE